MNRAGKVGLVWLHPHKIERFASTSCKIGGTSGAFHRRGAVPESETRTCAGTSTETLRIAGVRKFTAQSRHRRGLHWILSALLSAHGEIWSDVHIASNRLGGGVEKVRL